MGWTRSLTRLLSAGVSSGDGGWGMGDWGGGMGWGRFSKDVTDPTPQIPRYTLGIQPATYNPNTPNSLPFHQTFTALPQPPLPLLVLTFDIQTRVQRRRSNI